MGRLEVRPPVEVGAVRLVVQPRGGRGVEEVRPGGEVQPPAPRGAWARRGPAASALGEEDDLAYALLKVFRVRGWRVTPPEGVGKRKKLD